MALLSTQRRTERAYLGALRPRLHVRRIARGSSIATGSSRTSSMLHNRPQKSQERASCAMHTTRRSLLMSAGLAAITAVSTGRAFSQLLPTLPPALADVKALLRRTKKVAVFNVNGVSQVYTQVLKCGELEFATNAVLEFAALDFDWIVLYADVIKLIGAATVRRTDSINIDAHRVWTVQMRHQRLRATARTA
jgi:hypothetical protein